MRGHSKHHLQMHRTSQTEKTVRTLSGPVCQIIELIYISAKLDIVDIILQQQKLHRQDFEKPLQELEMELQKRQQAIFDLKKKCESKEQNM